MKDISGKRFGRLVVINIAGTCYDKAVWNCLCDCGVKKQIYGASLLRGLTKSCGCLRSEITSLRSKTHGKTLTKEYKCWNGMIQRCTNPNRTEFKNYGLRGIKVCERWLKFESFFEDMGYKPTSKHSIDRIENDGNYEPENCRWATKLEQKSNTRRNRRITVDGETKTLSQWCLILGVNSGSFYYRLRLKKGTPSEVIASMLKTKGVKTI